MSVHARLSPSNVRWPYCPGSIREEAAYSDVPGEAAIDGTGSHLLLEPCIQHNTRAENYLNQIIGEGHEDRPKGWLVKQDRCDRVQMALDYIARRRTEINGAVTIYSESLSYPGKFFGRDDWYGTADIVLFTADMLEVIDYKDGRMWVDVKNNSQFTSYATGKLGTFLQCEGKFPFDNITNSAIKTVRTTVIQPKTNPVIRYEEMPPVELWQKATQLAHAAKLTDDPNAPLVEGKHCAWCAHGRAGDCSAKNEKAMKGIEAMDIIGETNRTAPKDMTNEQIAEILDAAPLIKKMIETVEEEAMSRIDAGGNVPTYIIGTGNGSSEFADEEDVVERKLKGMRFKKADIYPAKLISPAQALKYEGLSDRQLKRLQEMIITVPGKKKVVKVKENGNGKPTAQEMFKDVATPTTMSFM